MANTRRADGSGTKRKASILGTQVIMKAKGRQTGGGKEQMDHRKTESVGFIQVTNRMTLKENFLYRKGNVKKGRSGCVQSEVIKPTFQ